MKKIWIPIAIGMIILLVPNIFYIYNIGCSITDDPTKWGQYGDFINPFLSIINITALFYLTYIVHKTEEERNQHNLKLEEKRHNETIEFENKRNNDQIDTQKIIAKNQLIVGKIEEIYEITSLLYGYYYSLLSLFYLYDNSTKQELSKEARATYLSDYYRQLGNLKNAVDTDDLYNHVARLKVLADCYLNQELKIKVLCYHDLFDTLFAVTIQGQYLYKGMYYKEGFPNQDNLHDYVDELETNYVKEIALSGESLKFSDLQKYREDFKVVLGLK